MSETPGVQKFSPAKLAVRVVKLSFSAVFCASDFVWTRLSQFVGKPKPGTCVILYYHAVPPQYRERFSDQMQIVKAAGKIVDLHHFDELPAGSRSIAITFDDALESFLVNAVPILSQWQIPATVFAVSEALGGKPAWGEAYYVPGETVMSSEQLCQLPETIAIGSHTLTHANLALLPPDEAGKEITQSRANLENLLQRPVTLFSFPFGVFNNSTVQQCREAGYKRVFTTEPALAVPGEFVHGRVSADPWDWKWEFQLKIRGAYRWQTATRNVTASIRKLFSKAGDAPGGLPMHHPPRAKFQAD